MSVFQENINLALGGIAAILAVLFGDFWWLFLAFFILNVVDYGTGIFKARYTKTSSSKIGAIGAAKKVGYWIIIGVAFFISVAFVEMGQFIGLKLSFMPIIGYFVLATYIINEIRSIIENLVVCGVNVPEFLIKGLDITKKILEDKANSFVNKKGDK